MRKRSSLVLLTLLLFSYCFSQDGYKSLYRFKKDNLYGFVNSKGKVVVEPQFFSTGVFSEGLCAVVKRENKESKLGYIDHNGELVIDLQFQQYLYEGSDFSEGMAVVRLNNKSGYINRQGEIIFEPTLYKGHPFKGGYAVIEKEHSVRLVINKEGKILFDPVEEYQKQRKTNPTSKESLYLNDAVSEGIITFALTNYSSRPSTKKMGYFDLEGNMFFPLGHLVGNFSEGLAKAYSSNATKQGFVDKEGKVIIPLAFKTVSDFQNGKALVQDLKTGLYGIINRKGEYLVQPLYRYISEKSFFTDAIMVKKDSYKTGYITDEGTPITEFKYEYGLDFSEGLALVYSREEGCQFIDKTGKPAFELEFEGPPGFLGGSFKGALAQVRVNNQNAYINRKGKVVFTF